ncbi:hypothetical protein E1B28_013563 [Marasmius oreades]|uniref:Protein kinase domain-containing protein n=1 Tax=Marasmius oreades TaxID=181124 RepID=A0A9P7RPT3_9AGAR|nr:uncharacterized protein E1B28_013563 [Marasmius oreades]KAG7087614.1 hypothetical protein E1B28_013563 [Marasmius oreades]
MEIVAALLEVVHNIHSAGFVHLDIKPANIAVPLRTTNDTAAATMLDFGVARMVTEGWMAPEMKIEGIENIDIKAADVWSVGRVLLFMASFCPFDEEQKKLVRMLGRRMTSPDPDGRPSLAEASGNRPV